MMKICLTLLLLGAFFEQGDALKCFDCVDDPTGGVCGGMTAATVTDEYCSIYSLDGSAPFSRGSANFNACGTKTAEFGGGQIWTCNTDNCNGDDLGTLAELPAAVPCEDFVATEGDCGEFCEGKCSTDDYNNCPSGTNDGCPDSNSATKTNRGFGVIMTSVSLSYVITKFL